MTKYNVAYDAPDGTRVYCKQWSDHETMQRMLRLWQELYGINGGKEYPCNWVQYEQAKALGYVHRILTEKVAVLHKLKRKA